MSDWSSARSIEGGREQYEGKQLVRLWTTKGQSANRRVVGEVRSIRGQKHVPVDAK